MLLPIFILSTLLSLSLTEVIQQQPYPNTYNDPLPTTTPYNQINPNFNYPESTSVNLSQVGISYQANISTGYLTVNTTTQSKIFYSVYPAGGSNNSSATLDNNAPMILWLQGGPGCADGTGNYGEIGPFTIVNQSGVLTPVLRNITWNDQYNLLFVDSPAGVGYSVTGNETYTNAVQVVEYLQIFLIRFFQVYSNIAGKELYIFGESYGGHYIPALASLIIQNITNNGLNLKGIGVGNGCTEVYHQAASQSDLAFSLGLLDEFNRDKLASIELQAQQQIRNGNLAAGSALVDQLGSLIGSLNAGINQYNFEQYPPLPAGSQYAPWLNLEAVKIAHGVDPNVTYQDCVSCHNDFLADLVTSYASNYTYLLSQTTVPDLKVLIYGGQNDLVCNNMGVQQYLRNLAWSEISGFIKSQKQILKDDDGNVIGNYKHHQRLTFAIIYAAGHMSPTDQPASARLLLEHYMENAFQ